MNPLNDVSNEQLASFGRMLSDMAKKKLDQTRLFSKQTHEKLTKSFESYLADDAVIARNRACGHGLDFGEQVAFELFLLSGMFNDIMANESTIERAWRLQELAINFIMNVSISSAALVLFIARSCLDDHNFKKTINGLFDAMDRLPDLVEENHSDIMSSLTDVVKDVMEKA